MGGRASVIFCYPYTWSRHPLRSVLLCYRVPLLNTEIHLEVQFKYYFVFIVEIANDIIEVLASN